MERHAADKVDFGNPVFRQDDDRTSAGACAIGKIAGNGVDFGE